MPGHENTDSVTTEKAIRWPNSSPTTVTIGISTLGTTWRSTSRAPPTPLARANLMYSCPATSRVPASASRATSEILNSDSVSAGSSRKRMPSQLVTDSGMPSTLVTGPRPPEGSQPRFTENTRMPIIPTQNVGMITPPSEPAISARASRLSGLSPANTPIGMPMPSDSSSAVTASSSVAGTRLTISSIAGRL
ncbi:hypothetical protein D3C81_1161240 [compost metagenome]